VDDDADSSREGTERMSGLGLAGFLGHTGGSGGKAGWLRRWVDSKRPSSCDVWLAAKGSFHPIYKVGFMFEDLTEDDNGRVERKLKFPKFVSPEPEIVLEHQYFRLEKKNMKTPLERPPTECPFLLLREWLLLHRTDLPPDAVIFEWIDRTTDGVKTIQWRKGDLTLETPKDKRNWRASLSPKLGYMISVVDNENRGDGIVLTEIGKGLADATRAVIRREIENLGADEGNPLKNPYAIRWKYRPDETPMKKYDALRLSRVEYDEDVYKLINADPPDIDPYVNPRDDDPVNIRAYMQAHAKIDLPLDQLFSDDVDVRAALAQLPTTARRAAPPAKDRSTPAGGGARPPADAPPTDGVRRRRKKKKEEPPPPPAEETIPCDDCKVAMSPTASECPNPKCDAEYDVDPEPAPSAGARAPEREEAPAAAAPPSSAGTDSEGTCALCDSGPVVNGICKACGMDQGDDDVPF
jgi:hypothetical protein